MDLGEPFDRRASAGASGTGPVEEELLAPGVPVLGQDLESGGESGDGVVVAGLALGLKLSDVAQLLVVARLFGFAANPFGEELVVGAA